MGESFSKSIPCSQKQMFKDNGKDDGITQAATHRRAGQHVWVWGFKYHSQRDRLRYNLIGKMSPPPPSEQSWIIIQRQNNFE